MKRIKITEPTIIEFDGFLGEIGPSKITEITFRSNNETKSNLTREELLEKVKKSYPAGTRFIGLEGSMEFQSNGEFYFSGLDLCVKGDGVYIYRKGKWAEVIEKPVFTNSIGEHFYEGVQIFYFWNKEENKLITHKDCLSEGYNSDENELSSEIFKTKQDVLKWALKNVK